MELAAIAHATVSLAGVLVLFGSFPGALHRLGDTRAVFWLRLAVEGPLCFAVGWALGRVSPWALLVPLASFRPTCFEAERAGEASLVLYQKNMSLKMPDTAALAADACAVSPDHVTPQAVAPANAAVLVSLANPPGQSALPRPRYDGGSGGGA